MSAPAPTVQPGEPAVRFPPGVDALAPPEMARRAEGVGVRKAGMDAATVCVRTVLAGTCIANPQTIGGVR